MRTSLRPSLPPQSRDELGPLNEETEAIVTALLEAVDSIKAARVQRKKPLARRHAEPEKQLEERLQAAANGQTATFADLCRGFGSEFMDFDVTINSELRAEQNEIAEIKGAIKYGMDAKKGLNDADSLELKVQAIKNRIDQALNDWSARVFAEMRAALERDRQSLVLSEAHDRTPAHPEDATFDDAPPLYEEFAPLGELPIQGPMLNASLNSDDHLASAPPAPSGRSRSASAHFDTTSSSALPAPSRAAPSTPAYTGYVDRDAPNLPVRPSMPGSYPTSDQAHMQHRASAPAVPTRGTGEPPRQYTAVSPPTSTSRGTTLGSIFSRGTRQRQGTTDSIASSSTMTSPASFSSPIQQSPSIPPIQRTSTFSSTNSSQPQSPSPNRRTSTISTTSSAHPTPTTPIPTTKRLKTLADLAATAAQNTYFNPVLHRPISGIPCRTNSYFGLCKGAWAIASSEPKALGLAHVPMGMHSFRRFVYCRACNFQGRHASPDGKVPVPDRAICVHPTTGIRFRWMFLAKSHLKCKDDSLGTGFKLYGQRYGCVFCVGEGKWPPTLQGVDALMYHILRFHAARDERNIDIPQGDEIMPELVRRRNAVIVGRLALPEEQWDLNIPVGYEEKREEERSVAEGLEGEGREIVEMGDGLPGPRELMA